MKARRAASLTRRVCESAIGDSENLPDEERDACCVSLKFTKKGNKREREREREIYNCPNVFNLTR